MSSQEDEANSYDLINVSGPLTIEAILKALQHRFNSGHNYVSLVNNIDGIAVSE
jgi:hypothetical protein